MTSRSSVKGNGADVLLLCNESRTAIAAARSFAANGIPFVAVSTDDKRGLLAASRSVERHVLVPSPSREPEAFIESLLDLARATGARLAVPVHDGSLRAANEFRDALADEGVTLAAGPSPAIDNILDKRANLATASRLGIPLPAQFELESLDDVPAMIEALGFPIVLKPSAAGPAGNRQPFRFKWLVVRDEPELRAALAEHCPDGVFPLFQELLRGKVVGLYCFAAQGRLVAALSSVAERRSMGQNVLRTMIPVDPTLEGYARAMFEELRWDGPAALAFFVDPSGKVAYLETNGRLWGSLQSSVRAGWDFPKWSVRYFLDGTVPIPPALPLGDRGCWRVGDLIGLVCVLKGEAWLTDREDVGRFQAVRDYLSSFKPGINADVFRLDDPMPELIEHWQWLRPPAGRALRRLGGSLRR